MHKRLRGLHQPYGVVNVDGSPGLIQKSKHIKLAGSKLRIERELPSRRYGRR